MLNKELITKYLSGTIEKIKDTRYITCDISERLELARMDVAAMRAALIDARDGEAADMYASKLKAAQKEYLRVLKLSRSKKNAV